MSTKKKAEKLPLDLLAERVMRKVSCHEWLVDGLAGEHSLPPCTPHLHCRNCHGTNTVFDPRWKVLREALWEECLVASRRRGTRHDDSDQHTARCDCGGTGFIRRNRAEAAYNLWAAAKPTMRAEGWFLVPVEDGWEIWCSFREEHFHVVAKRCINPEDALSAALLARMDMQEVKA